MLAQFGVHLGGQEEARGPGASAGFDGLEKDLQVLLLQPLQHRVGQRFQFSLRRSAVSLGRFPWLAQAANPAPASSSSGPMRPSVRSAFCDLAGAFLSAGRPAPPESSDEHRSFGPEHAGREEGSPAKKRACRPQFMKESGAESRQPVEGA